MKTSTRGYMAALIATVVWSGNFIVARGVADVIPPVQLNFWRWTVALLCVLPLALPRLRQDWAFVRPQWKFFVIISFLGITLLNALVYKAGQTTGSLNMGLLLPTAPILIIVLSRVLYSEPITPRRLVGLVLVLCGVVFLVSRGSWENILAVRFTAGDFWALGGVAGFALYSLFMRHKPQGMSTAGFNAITFAIGLALSVPPLLWEMAVLPAPQWTGAVWAGVLYSGVGCSFVAYLLWTRAIDDIGPVCAGMVYYTIPLFVAIESVTLLGEGITVAHVVGGGMIISGIVVATFVARRA